MTREALMEIVDRLLEHEQDMEDLANANKNPQARLMFRRAAAKVREAYGFAEAGASYYPTEQPATVTVTGPGK